MFELDFQKRQQPTMGSSPTTTANDAYDGYYHHNLCSDHVKPHVVVIECIVLGTEPAYTYRAKERVFFLFLFFAPGIEPAYMYRVSEHNIQSTR